MFTSPTQVLAKLGGPSEVAAALNRPYTTVHSWVQRGWIPPAVWVDLVEVAKANRVKGVTLDALAALPKPKKARAQ